MVTGGPEQLEQYIVTNHDPSKENVFQTRKRQKGSKFLFHGSALENWYSILRNGLRNLSNSHMMTAGAAYGQGIYASCHVISLNNRVVRHVVGLFKQIQHGGKDLD